MKIRRLVRRDLSQVLDIENKAFESPLARDDFLSLLRRNCAGKVAADEDQVLGFLIYQLHPNYYELIDVAVDPGCQRRSIGRQLVASLVKSLRPYHRTQISLAVHETNLSAQLFFKALGFKATKVVRCEETYLMDYRLETTHAKLLRNS